MEPALKENSKKIKNPWILLSLIEYPPWVVLKKSPGNW
jgi:hypothetical protein